MSVKIEKYNVVILGAGISGLSTGFYIKKYLGLLDSTDDNKSFKLKILEKDNRIGGLIETHKPKDIVNCLFELGPRCLRISKSDNSALEFVNDLNLIEETITANHRNKGHYVFHNGNLKKVPDNFISIFTSSTTKGVFRAIYKSIFSQKAFRTNGNNGTNNQDESILEFTVRNFGSDITNNLVDPLISGIWAGDINKLSIKATMPSLVKMEENDGPLIKSFIKKKLQSIFTENKSAHLKLNFQNNHRTFYNNLLKSGLYSFKNGMDDLVNKTASYLPDEIELNSQITKIIKKGDLFHIYYKSGSSAEREIVTDILISSIPAYSLSAIPTNFDAKLKSKLNQIEYAPIAIVVLAFKNKIQTNKGFGYLVPRKENQNILGVQWHEKTFPEFNASNGSSVTVFIGGMHFEKFHSYSKTKFIDLAINNLKKHLDIKLELSYAHCKILKKALPQYNIGHLVSIDDIKKCLPKNFYINANYINGVGINSIIYNTKKISKLLVKDILN